MIRRRPPAWGLFSNIFFVIQGIIYCEKNGYIPIVDMENYWVGELSSVKKINGTHNAWCYLFEQVSTYSLDEIYKSKNVILSNGYRILEKDHWLLLKSHELIMSREKLKYIGDIISRYIKMNSFSIDFVAGAKANLNWNSEDTLGVFVRGGNYYFNAGSKSEDIPEYENLKKEIETLVKSNEIKSIYICTENLLFYRKLKSDLKSLNVINNLRYPDDLTIENWQSQQKLTFDNSVLLGYERSLIYLTEIMLLSECKFSLFTNSNASTYALCLSDLELGDHLVLLKESLYRV